MNEWLLRPAAILAAACLVSVPLACGGQGSVGKARTLNYTAEEVRAAFTQAGIEVLDSKTGTQLLPPEFAQPNITLITAGIRDPTSQVVYRFGLEAFVYHSAKDARASMRRADQFGFLSRRFRNVIVSVTGFGVTPKILPPEVLDAMKRLG